MGQIQIRVIFTHSFVFYYITPVIKELFVLTLLLMLLIVESCKKNDSSDLHLPVVQTDTVYLVRHTTASCAGNVLSDCGYWVYNRGVCWSTIPDPDMNDSHKKCLSGMGSFTINLAGLNPMTTYYLRAYAINAEGTSYGDIITFTTMSPDVHYIGESFGGGVVFYVDSTQHHGLISARLDQGHNVRWGCQGSVVGNTGTGLGEGLSNTAAIIGNCSESDCAAFICDTLTLNGFYDWFLPSRDELSELSRNRGVVDDLDGGYYWSSSEVDSLLAWRLAINTGKSLEWKKGYPIKLRAIRSF